MLRELHKRALRQESPALLQARRIRQPGRDRITLFPSDCDSAVDHLFESPGEWIEADPNDVVDLGGAR